ncbi:hypothetical protein CVS40_2053 [Lucilia cuprina]|nr:hypothetical protein CVS40_2053 [Lucilia cuprina]
MKIFLKLIIMQFLIHTVWTWNVEYVGQQLVLPIAKGTQETLYCVCEKCWDDNLDLLMKWNSDTKRNILSLIIAYDFEDPIFKIHQRLLTGRHFYINIILMLEPVEDFQKVIAVLRYLYEQKFVNSDVYYLNASSQRNEVFSYDAYPRFAVLNKSHLVGDVRKFYYKIIDKTDLKGYRFDTPLMQDPPKVIRYKNKLGWPRIQGVTYNIIQLTLAYLNGTLNETETQQQSWQQDRIPIVDMKYILEQVRERKVELAAHAYALFHNDARVQKSYPLLVVNWCLMVPIFNHEFTMFYPFMPFQWKVWLTFTFAFVVINITRIPPKPTQNPTKLWFDMLLNGFIFIQSFFLCAFYTSTLGSFLTVTIIRKQINSLAELIESQLPIMIIDYELEFLLEAQFDLPLKFWQLLRPVNSSTFYRHQFTLNSSYGYFTTYDTWHFLNLQQKHLKPALFRYTDICFGDYHLAFPMITESPIWRDVEYLMLRIHSSGLYYYHEQKSFEYAIRAGLVRYRNEHSGFQTVGFVHLKLVLGFFIFGLFVSLLRFFYELWQNWKMHKLANVEYSYLKKILFTLLGYCQAMAAKEFILQQQVLILMDLMVELHKHHNFDNVIIYRTPGSFYEPPVKKGLMLATRNQGESLHVELIRKSLGNLLARHVSEELRKPVMIFTIAPWKYVNNTKAIPNLGSILTNKNLAVVILNDIFDTELKEFVSLSLGASLETKIVFLAIGHELTDIFTIVRVEKMRRFFRWCWSKNLLNVILLFQRDHIDRSLEELKLEVYTYTPFPRPIKFIQLTQKPPREYFRERISNLLGYRFRTPVFEDKPLVFKSKDLFTGADTVTGITGLIYREYTKYINATYRELKNVNFNGSWIAVMGYINDLLNARKIDISIHPLTALKPNHFFNSYPITNTNCCVVVPVKPEIFPALYLPLTLSVKMWSMLLVLFLTFQLSYMFVNHDNYGDVRTWLAFSTTLKGLLSMPLGNMGHFKTITRNSIACRRKIFLHMLLLLSGMIYGQTHIAALTSFLSSTLFPQQIESLEDLRKSNISIMLLDYIHDTFNYLDLIPDNFSSHIIISDPDTVSYHLNHLNTSYAYTVFKDEWRVIQRLQMNLWKPRFRIVSKLCIPNVYMTLPMQFNSPFYHSLMRFILRVQTTGLEIKWSDMIFLQIQKATGLNTTLMENLEHPVPLTLVHFMYIFYIYTGGMLMAIVVFLLEVIQIYL